MLSGLAPDSMIDETNAANSGGDQPDSFERSVWMKSNPYSGWPRFSMRPYMWTPQSLQAYRWIAALGSTIASLLPFALTLRLSRVTTATCENSAPFGFQHLVQPHTWLCADCPLIAISTLFCEQLQNSVPPAKFFAAGFNPPSTAGCILTLLMMIFSFWTRSRPRAGAARW